VVKIDPMQQSSKTFLSDKLADDIKLVSKLDKSESVVIDVNKGFVSIQIPLPASERGKTVYTSANVPRGNGLRVPLGLDTFNEPVYFNFENQTDTNLSFLGVPGSGKSVSMRRSIVTLARNNQPNDVKFLMIEVSKDALDLRIFSNLPHLVHRVIVDPVEACQALAWAVNQIKNGKLPYKLIVCVDEVAELIRQQPDTVPMLMTLISQGRAVNVVNMLATQITDKSTLGDGKAIFRQIHSTILGKVSNKQLSYVMGNRAELKAEALTGMGDLMLNSNDVTTRFAGVFTTKSDLERLPQTESIPSLPIADYSNTEAIVSDLDSKFESQPVPLDIVSEGLISLQKQMDNREYRQAMQGKASYVLPASQVKALGRNYLTFRDKDQPYITELYKSLWKRGIRLCKR
jgi:DNA segregation ATPase FtsK/SpoIIIE-like protein